MDEKKFLDSLQHIVSTTGSDSVRANTYFFISDYWRFKDTTKSRTALNNGKNIVFAKKNSSSEHAYLQGLYYFYLGQHYFNWDKALAAQAYQKAEQLFRPFNHSGALLLRAACWYNYALMVRAEKGDSFVTDILLNKSIPLADKTDNLEKRAHYYSQLGALLMYSKQFEKSEGYNKKAIELLEKAKPNSPTLFLSYLTATDNYIQLKDFDKARQMLDKAEVLLKIYPESVNASYYYFQRGSYYLYRKDLANAIRTLDKGIESTLHNNQFHLQQMMLFRKYEVLVELGKYQEAKKILTALSHPENSILQDLNSKKEIYGQMVKIHELTNNIPEAHVWSKKYNALADSLHKSETDVKISDLEAKYNTSEKEKQITKLEAARREADLDTKNTRLTAWSLAIMSILLLAVAIISYLYYRNNKKLLQEQNQNHIQQLKEIEQTEKIKYSKALMAGEETERKRLAQDLHDGLGGTLVGVKMNLSGKIEEGGEQVLATDLDPIIKQLDQSVSELRRIAHNMMPINLIKFGLETAIRDLCESMISEQLQISFQAYDIETDIPEQTQLNIYRIVQELLNNSRKHGKASEILLQCSQEEHTFLITMEDNGLGFDTSTLESGAGMGFHNIRNRVGYLNGSVDITSSKGEGTTVNIELYV